ncbi:MBL fold metallo-hydrolase [Spirillospora sp. NPDC048911]|uniref:MBL fold metallo-hydrolase n=1 Tax=Spirillospora sp. NPDC048911 TaxID=3364527 RepID=UPI003714ABEC
MDARNLTPRLVAGIEIIPLLDAIGPMGGTLRRPPGELFPGGSAERWDRVRAGEPLAFGPEDEWVLHFYCYLLRVPGGPNILVDTGLGPLGSPAATWAPVPGDLVNALGTAGVAPAEIDSVVITHLHSDHASGAVVDGEPVFPNARHVLQDDEVAWLERTREPILAAILEPLRAADLVDTISGDVPLAPGVRLIRTPGHTPGHQSILVGDDELLVTGDILHHPIQLADPSISYLYDDDPAAALATRTALLARIRERGGTLATPHLPSPFNV